MKLGFTVDEKVFDKMPFDSLIQRASEYGVSSIEVSPDVNVLPLEMYKSIVSSASCQNIDINYHIPYFADDIYELEHFSLYENQTKKKYESFLYLLEELQSDVKNNPIIVVHGADYTEKSVGMDNTLKFLDWILNIFASRNLNFTLALETLRKKQVENIFNNREDIFYVLNKFNLDNLKICWDMCHDKLNLGQDKAYLDKNFLEQVVYCHIHGHNLDSDTSHISLIKSDLDYSKEIELLTKSNFKGSMNIELLSNFCEDTYIEDLFSDLNYMNNLL